MRNLNRRLASAWSVFWISLFLPAVLSAQTAGGASELLPNILWLSTEDIGPHFSFYGDETANTPNLTELAQQGMVYDVAWSNYPVCAPARTTLITGMFAASNGAGNMRSTARLPGGIPMFPQLLREAGYRCTNNSKEDYNHPKPGKVWDASSGSAHYRDRQPGQPFFAVFNHTGTHESRIRKRPHEAIIDPAAVTLAPYWPDHPAVRQDWAQYYDNLMRLDGWVGKKLDELGESGESERTIVVFFGDHGSGMPRHKRFAGDSGMRVPLIVYVPPALKHLAPADYEPGGHSERLVSFVDFAPTMLSIAGIEPPGHMQGNAWMGKHATRPKRTLLGLRSRMDERPDLSRSLRDNRFVYIRNFLPHLPHGQVLDYQMQTPTTEVWKQRFEAGDLNPVQSAFWQPRPSEELYDLEKDPHETNNLAMDPQHAATLDRFRSELRQRLIGIHDSGFIPESELVRIRDATTVREYCCDPSQYPLDAVYDLAVQASSPSVPSIAELVDHLEAEHPVLRFWAAVGMLVRGASVVQANMDALEARLADDSPAVAIVAAEALARFSADETRQAALQRLVHYADLENGSFFAAVEALNALDRCGELPERIKSSLGEIPRRDPEVKRSGDNIERLLVHLGVE